MATILVSRHLKTTEDLHNSRPSPRTAALVGSAVQWAEQIMRRIDGNPLIQRIKAMAELRSDSLFGVAPGHGRKGQNGDSGGPKLAVRKTSRSRLREADLRFEGQRCGRSSKTPNTGSSLAQLGREGKKVMQFLVTTVHRRCRGWEGPVLWSRSWSGIEWVQTKVNEPSCRYAAR